MVLLDKWGKDGFDSNEEYKKVRKNISRRLLSTNKEVFPTIPEGMARIDVLREEKKMIRSFRKVEQSTPI